MGKYRVFTWQTTCLLLYHQGNSPRLQAQPRGQREELSVPHLQLMLWYSQYGTLGLSVCGETMPKQDETPMVEAPSVTMTHVGKTGKCIKYKIRWTSKRMIFPHLY